MSETINCGERQIQKSFRISLRDVCENHDIVEGDIVEVSIKKVK